MTLGFLITTNEHSTIISLHEQLIKKLGCYQQDLEIISSFLNCKVKRINKSSSLWYLLKKLTLSQVYEKKDHILLKKLSLRALKSCQIHFANYYANNYLRWIITMNQLLGISNDFLMKELRKLCHLILSDSSLWSTFCFLIGGSNEKHFEFVIFELSQVTNSNFQFDNTNKVDYQNIIIDEFKWLINVQCHYLSPFKLLIQSCESIEILQLIKLKSQDIKFDEKLRIEIIKLIDFQISILQTKSTT
ncbi:hypothetical protein KGF54_002551 [Candida jiufengensis]|uniref:uncharacterized protein n=1 Tax=Candida jiufengensis TaxID=497108 RepID=UPI0022253845|nr:uncharacterized protein KGF54_002551 [Candida jiufengensis]KAI5953180.1 hypothetical protein KGF54_002551 [Candida jiufengensis]